MGYIYNLVCTAILFSIDSVALKDAKYDYSQPQDDSKVKRVIEELDNTLRNGSKEQQHYA